MSDSKIEGQDSGFTLLEILIAVTLLAFITLAVVNITDNAFITKDRTTEINKNNLQIETAMSRFEWDFSQIYSPMYFSTPMQAATNQFSDGSNAGGNTLNNENATPDAAAAAAAAQPNMALQAYYQALMQRFERNEHFITVSKEGLPIPRFYAPEKNTFEFFVSSNRRKMENTRESHFAWVRYGLGDPVVNPNKEVNPNLPQSLKTLVRYYRADDPYDDKRINPQDENIKSAVLLENVESLEFQYWDYQRKKWETSLTSIQNGETIIRGVKMTVAWYDSQGLKRVSSRIFRNLWPMVVFADPQTTAGGTNAGTPTGGTNGTAGAQGGTAGNNSVDDVEEGE